MQNKVMGLLGIILFSHYLYGCSSQQVQHTRNLNTVYPYGVIGDDYGILNEDDLAINTCNVKEVEPFSLTVDTSYPYWKCYSAKDVSILCDDPDYDEDEKSLMVILDLEVRSLKEGNHDYLTRRAIRLESCKYFQNQFKKTTVNESHVCVSGEFWKIDKRNDGNSQMIWSFDKFKTKKGCVSYFADKCNLKAQLDDGCIPITKKK